MVKVLAKLVPAERQNKDTPSMSAAMVRRWLNMFEECIAIAVVLALVFILFYC